MKSIGLVFAVFLCLPVSFGQGSFTWNGGGGDNNWTTGGNWGGTAPGSPQNNLNFSGSTRTSPNNNFGSYSGGYRIFFNTGASSFTLGGNPIKFFDFGGNRAIIQNDSANTQTIDLRVGAGNSTGGLDFYANAGDIVYTGGAIDNGTVFMDGGSQIRFPANNGRTITFHKGIINGDQAGSVAIQANTIVIYNAPCTYSGGTFLDAGQLRISTNCSVAGTGAITIGPTSGAADTAVYAQPAAGGLTVTNAITVRSGGSGTVTVGGLNTSGQNTFSGAISLQKSATFSAAGGGTIVFSGTIDYQNPTTGVGRTLTVSGSGDTSITGAFINGASGSSVLSKSGTGTLTLSGNNAATAIRVLYNQSGGVISISAANNIGVPPTPVNYPDKYNFLDNAILKVSANSFTLGRFTTSSDLVGFRIQGTRTGTFDIASGSTLTIDGPIIDVPSTGAGALTKTGSGTLQLNQANGYTGSTTISQGTLLVNGSLASGSAVTVQSGATLGGTGSVNGSITVNTGGTLAPGMSIGILTVGIAPTLNGTISMEIDRNGSPSADKLVLSSGTIMFGGALTVANSGAPLVGGESFDLFDASNFAGAFSATNLPSLSAGLNWWTDRLFSNGSIYVNRAPTGLDKTYTRNKGTSLKIAKVDLLVGASDADSGDGDLVSYDSLANTGSQGAAVTQDSTYIYYLPANDNPDTLQYRLKDNRGGTVTKNIQINVGNSEGLPQTITVAGSSVTVSFAGIPGYSYEVQRSTNLSTWLTLGNTNAPSHGVFEWIDTFSGLDSPPPSAYYRLRQP